MNKILLTDESYTLGKGNKVKSLADVNLSDNFLFVKVMSDEIILKQFLEIILKIKIKELRLVQYEKTVISDIRSKSIRMDIYADDSENAGRGTLYNVEMQQKDTYNINKRSRYYQSAIDMDSLMSGADYNELSKSYIIFICLFDPFKYNYQRYTFTKICEENYNIKMNDGTTTLVLTDNPGDPEIEKFFSYLKNTTTEEAERSGSDFVKLLNERVQRVKYDPKTEVEYLTFEMLQRDQYNMGVADCKKSIIEKLKKKGFSEKEISELIDITPREVENILLNDK